METFKKNGMFQKYTVTLNKVRFMEKMMKLKAEKVQ
jgi:hypothetical protein